jgi:hypothetical protein
MSRGLIQTFIMGLAVFVTACNDGNERIESTVVPTSNTYADINVSSDDGINAFVTTQLKEGAASSETYVDLQSGDRLIASMDERFGAVQINGDLFSNLDHYSTHQKTMDRHDSGANFEFLWLEFVRLSQVWYFTSFDGVSDGDKVYVSYLRGNPHVSAPDSYVVMPSPFTITSPTTGSDTLYSRTTDGIDISWLPANSNAAVNLSVNANCENGGTATYSTDLADSGSHTIAANTIGSLTGPCTYTIKIEKSVTGTLDSHFGAGGIIKGRQIRGVNVNTTD